MMSKRIFKEEQICLIMECRQSGLTDYQWCEQNGIHPGNFYNWVIIPELSEPPVRTLGATIPENESRLFR